MADDKKVDAEEQIQKSFEDLKKSILDLHTAAAPHSRSESFLAHTKLTYWDTALAKSLEAMQAKLEQAKPNDPSISKAFASLHAGLQLQNAEMVATKTLDFKASSKHFDDAKTKIATIAGTIDAKTAKDNGVEPADLNKQLDSLKESGIKKHIEEQSEHAKRAQDQAFSEAYRIKSHAHYKGWTHGADKAQKNELAAIRSGQSVYKDMKAGIYKEAEANYNLFAVEKDGKFRVKANASVANIGYAIGQAVDLMILKNKTPIEIFFEDPRYASLDVIKKIVEELTDKNKPFRESIITLDPQMGQYLPLSNDKDRAEFKRLSGLIDAHNVQFKNNQVNLHKEGQKLGAKTPDAKTIVNNENEKRLQEQSAKLEKISAKSSDDPEKQIKKDSNVLAAVEKALREVQRQQALLELKHEAKAPAAEIKQASANVILLSDQIQKALARVTTRLEPLSTGGPTEEIQSSAGKSLEKAEKLKTMVDNIRSQVKDGSLAKEIGLMKVPADLPAVKATAKAEVDAAAAKPPEIKR